MRRRMTQEIAESEDFTTHVYEVTRRMAILDFLGLYEQARQDGIIGRIKYITQSTGFNEYEPQGWEVYITRLLGRCLRYWIPYSSVIEKQRNRMCYNLYTSRIPEFAEMAQLENVLTCRGNYHPHYRIWRAANNNAREYWRTRESIDSEMVDALYRWYDTFRGGLSGFSRVRVGQWPGCTIDYGQAQYRGSYYRGYGMRHRATTFGRYNSSESYMEFKDLLTIIGSLHQHPEMFEMLDTLAAYDVADEQRQAREEDMAQRNARVATGLQTRLQDIPNNRLVEELQRRGVINANRPEADEDDADDADAPTNTLTERFMESLRARGRIT